MIALAAPSQPRSMLRCAQLCELLADVRMREGREDEADALAGEAAALRFLAVAQ